MAHRKLFKQKQRQRITLRMILLTVMAIFTFIAVGLSVFFSLYKPDKSKAGGNTMILSEIKVSQQEELLYRGTANNVVMKVNVITQGNAAPLELKNINFNYRGTTKPVDELIRSARLWYTGNNNTFLPASNFGVTVSNAIGSDGSILFEGSQQLSQGSNYFWLTYDIDDANTSSDGIADAECISVRIGSLEYRPDQAAPPQKFKIADNIAWYAVKDGDIQAIDTWNSKRDGSGSKPVSFGITNSVYIIPPGKTLSNKIGTNLPIIIIENDSRLITSSKLTADLLQVRPKGILRFDEEIELESSPASIKVYNNGTIIHNNPGQLVATASFEPESNLWITRQPAPSFRSGKYVPGNVIADFEVNNSYNLFEIGSKIKGDLEIRNSGKGFIYFASDDTLQILGNLILNDGTFSLTYGDINTITYIRHNLICNGGEFTNQKMSGRYGKAKLLISGDVVINNTRVNLSAPNTNPAQILIKTSTPSKWYQREAGINLCDIIIEKGSQVTLTGNTLGPIPKGCTLTLAHGAMLNCREANIIGSGSFSTEQYSILGIGHTEGISSTGNTGNILTTIRNFNSGSTYLYNGIHAIQRTGWFTTTPKPDMVREVNVALRNPNGLLVLDKDLNIEEQVTLTSGYLVKNNFKITVKGTEFTSVK